MKFYDISSSDGDMLLVVYGTFHAVLYANLFACDLEGCHLRSKRTFIRENISPLGPPALSLHTCAAKSHGPNLEQPKVGSILGGFLPRAGTFKEGTRTFMADTVYLLLDT